MKWDLELIDDIIENINSNRIVPLVGSGAYCIQESTGDISVQEYVVKEALKIIRKEDDVELTEDEKQKYCCGYKGMTRLNKVFEDAQRSLKNAIRKIYSSTEFKSKIKLIPKVENFLRLGNFPLILTTCVFRELEKILPKYVGKCRVYQLDGNPDQGIPNNVTNEPCLYYLFGSTESIYDEAVLTERDYLKFLYNIQDTSDRPKNLIEYISPQSKSSQNKKGIEKYLLSIGCDVPDWTYRFLIISLKEQNGDLKYQSRKEDVFLGGVVNRNHKIDEVFDEFLASIGYYSGEDLDGLLEDINKRLEGLPQKKKPTLFLSVNSDEYEKYGDKIEEMLRNDFEVWYFPKNGKKRYWKCIKEGLEDCQFFMPVVTNETIVKLKKTREKPEPDKEVGIITELHMALEEMKSRGMDKIYCIPYVLETTSEVLKSTLDESCPNKDLFQLFFPGNELIEKPIEKFSVNDLNDFINEA